MEMFGILIDTIVTNMKMLNLLNGLLPENKDEKINSILAKYYIVLIVRMSKLKQQQVNAWEDLTSNMTKFIAFLAVE